MWADLDEGGPQRRRGVAHGEAVTGRVGICLLGLEDGLVGAHGRSSRRDAGWVGRRSVQRQGEEKEQGCKGGLGWGWGCDQAFGPLDRTKKKGRMAYGTSVSR